LGIHLVLKQTVQKFLNQYHQVGDPLLLALSGGSDSMALYHVLKTLRVDFAVAHVNHNWRPESKAEADQLQRLVSTTFHLHALDPKSLTGNLEDACRGERLAFFKKLCADYGYKAVIMGHHADDQAETVLKRLFEGASIAQLGGIREVSSNEGVEIWRPLLTISKGSIIDYCSKGGIAFFDDYTNRDERYLRARMRQTLMPMLSQAFKKEIAKPLAKLGSDSQELKDYLDQKVELLLKNKVQINGRWRLDLSESHPVEIKHLLKRFLGSSAQIDDAADLIIQKKPDKSIGTLYIHMGNIFSPSIPCDDIHDLVREENK
jgi:tRNA(Ile)-lysidine synthase